MGSNRRSQNYEREYTREQRLVHENKKLKQEIKRLRNQVKRLSTTTERHKDLVDLVQQQYTEEKTKKAREEVKAKWACHKCQEGTLKMIVVPRRDGSWYFRKCDHCDNRTRLQKYTDQVEKS